MDTFFGYDTSLPADSSGEEEGDGSVSACGSKSAGKGSRSPAQRGPHNEASDEDEYNALNDETFGAADKGDWECIHENLVRLELGVSTLCEEDDASSELDDGQSSALLLDDYDLHLQIENFNLYDTNDESGRSSMAAQSIGEEFASKLRLDPSIWDSPTRKPAPQLATIDSQRTQNVFSPLKQTSSRPAATEARASLSGVPINFTPPAKMLAVEDIERSIIQQQRQQQQKRNEQLHQQQMLLSQQKAIAEQQLLQNLCKQQPQQPFNKPLVSKEATTIKSPMPMAPPSVMPTPRSNVPPMMTPPQLLAARNPLFPNVAPPLLTAPPRVPVGYFPYNLMRTPFTTPINNLSMHPAFPGRLGHPLGLPLPPGAIGPQLPPMPLRHPGTPFLLPPSSSSALAGTTPLQNNQFNQRLVQEIQQNHPLLAFNRHLAGALGNSVAMGNNGPTLHQKHLQWATTQQLILQHQFNQQQQHQLLLQQQQQIAKAAARGGGARDKRDEHANMMSNREKQWLIAIQLTQLNSDTPYLSDYYFTVYKERMAALKGDSDNRAYKNNQLNHPFAQSTPGGSKTVTGYNRERKVSEPKANGTEGKDAGRPCTPLQFANSLGKLQYGSVIAPRKIIDMDVIGNDQVNGNSGPSGQETTLMQRKARHVLMLIETLYRLVLKLEDLQNPTAMKAAVLLREKREREHRLNHQDASFVDDTESFDELVASVVGHLSQEKTAAIMLVRKGKVLLRRILVVLRNHTFRWTMWAMIFTALPFLQRRDRDDAEGLVVVALHTEFEHQLQNSTVTELLGVAQAIGSNKVLPAVVSCKFLLSSLISIIFQMEMFYGRSQQTVKGVQRKLWTSFLGNVLKVFGEAQPQSDGPERIENNVKVTRDGNIIRTLGVHFERFGPRLDGTSLLNFITENASDDGRGCQQ
ncbi:protein PAT1 homolog 1-like [Anopheles cruzii]|uniref:protein PAT1 homolog 1-like n=1 Tax=Anopheles cruzii TaxID=68878 RepID=UPI0022EC6E31|nr:protein PAT1 homolog 1-like [Anopheles cruzii]